jgi:hypothetical protein
VLCPGGKGIILFVFINRRKGILVIIIILLQRFTSHRHSVIFCAEIWLRWLSQSAFIDRFVVFTACIALFVFLRIEAVTVGWSQVCIVLGVKVCAIVLVPCAEDVVLVCPYQPLAFLRSISAAWVFMVFILYPLCEIETRGPQSKN